MDGREKLVLFSSGVRDPRHIVRGILIRVMKFIMPGVSGVSGRTKLIVCTGAKVLLLL